MQTNGMVCACAGRSPTRDGRETSAEAAWLQFSQASQQVVLVAFGLAQAMTSVRAQTIFALPASLVSSREPLARFCDAHDSR